MSKTYILIIALLALSNSILAQGEDWATKLVSSEFKLKQVIPPTPEAAGLGKFGNTSVSLFNGRPSINIPLLTLSGNQINLPVQLSYNAGGFNPQEIAGWVGLAWSLNAGGVITRSVMGNPDDISNYFISPSPLVVPNQITNPFDYYDYMENLRKGYIEAQPDAYFYNFAGHSGKFFINPDNTIFSKEKNNYQINANVSTAQNSYFIITDDQGVKYEFREFESSNMTPDDISTDVPIRTYTYPSTWYLTKITSADGFEEIELSYFTTALKHSQFNNFFQSQSAVYEFTQSNIEFNENTFYGPDIKSSTPATVKTERKYLQQISLKKSGVQVAYIDFESVVDQRQDLDHNSESGFPGERLLNSIKLYSKTTQPIFSLSKQFNFSFGYFNNNNNNSQWHYKRLKLESIQEIPHNSTTQSPQPYLFEYINDGLMPSLYTTAMDHWGFYNTNNGGSLIPTTTIINGQINITAINRQASLENSSAYTINKITYPTGGYSNFEYELNKAKNNINSNLSNISVGGIRIKTITDYALNNKVAQQKQYTYTLDDGTTSGKCALPNYLSSSQYKSFGTLPGNGGYPSICSDGLLSTKTTYSISVNSIIGLGSVQGSHIGYSRVTERTVDYTNNESLGKIIYHYYIKEGEWDPNDDFIGNGDLLKKEVYDNSNKLIQETNNTYNYINLGSIAGVSPGINTPQDNRNTLVKTNTPGSGISYGWYMSPVCATNVIESRIVKSRYINAGWITSSRDKQLTQQVMKQFDQLSNNYITVTKKYSYNNTTHTLPTKIEQSTSNDEVIVTEKKYSLDYIIPNTGNLDNYTKGIKLLIDKNIIGSEIENIQYRQNENGTNRRYLNGLITHFDPFIPFPNEIKRLELTSPISNFTLSTINSGVFTFNGNYKTTGNLIYNSNGTLLQQSKYQDVPTSYIWDYDNRYTTAEIINASYGNSAYTSFESDGNGEWSTIPNSNLFRESNYVLSGRFSYNIAPGYDIFKDNLSSSKNYLVSYWSRNGSLNVNSNIGNSNHTSGNTYNGWTYYEHIIAPNSTFISLSTNTIKNIDELRLYPKNALMTTVTYNSIYGAISQVSANNTISHFEYDGLSRLLNIKDEGLNILKSSKYNYGTDLTVLNPSSKTLFYNTTKESNFIKQGCPIGSEGSSVKYIVPYGRYVSSTNQIEADIKAQTELNANGQSYANANGQCLYWNDIQTQYFNKNNCQYEHGLSQCSYTGNPTQQSQILYTVQPHIYFSTIDKQSANALAWVDINSNGQNYANNYCWCNCSEEGKRFINGNCETGTRYNSSSTYLGNGMWQCTYYYEFSDSFISQFYNQITSSPCLIY